MQINKVDLVVKEGSNLKAVAEAKVERSIASIIGEVLIENNGRTTEDDSEGSDDSC